MGLCSSNVYHVEEKGIDDATMQYLNYAEQPDEEYKQLDTENDQKGDTAVEHIFKKTKTVYGQPPKDMKGVVIDWKTDYEIDLKKRPCPYDFPAFQSDKPADYDEKKKEAERVENEKIAKEQKSPHRFKQQEKRKSRSKSTPSKGNKRPQRSANVELDQCSLDD